MEKKPNKLINLLKILGTGLNKIFKHGKGPLTCAALINQIRSDTDDDDDDDDEVEEISEDVTKTPIQKGGLFSGFFFVTALVLKFLRFFK